MSAFKKLRSADSFYTVHNAHKSYSVPSASFSTYGITLSNALEYTGSVYPSDAAYTQSLNYRSIKHLYYDNFNVTGSLLVSGSYEHYLESSLFSGSRILNESSSIFSFPKNITGTYINPGTFEISAVFGTSESDRRKLIDSGEGYLTYSGSASTDLPAGITSSFSVGDINYKHGTVVVTNEDLVEWFAISSSYTASWESTQPVFTLSSFCKVLSSDFLFTSNPSACQSEAVLSGSLSYSGGLPKDNVTGSEFAPYITTVGLYNDVHELIAVAKLGQPIPKSKTNDMTFVVKFDI
jgi:hypothetical protein